MTRSAEYKVADALRLVALRLGDALESGRRSNRLTANDLLETLLSVADELDPPVANPIACPNCGERNADRLVWQPDGEMVRCAGCGTTFQPAAPKKPGCEFCRCDANRPDGPFICPYCQQSW